MAKPEIEPSCPTMQCSVRSSSQQDVAAVIYMLAAKPTKKKWKQCLAFTWTRLFGVFPQLITHKNFLPSYFCRCMSSLYLIQFKVNYFIIEVVSLSKISPNTVKNNIL